MIAHMVLAVCALLIPSWSYSEVINNFKPMGLSIEVFWDADYYADCILEHIKPGMDARSIGIVEQGCQHKATPRKCREIKTLECLTECKAAGYWRNKVGECSLG